jgi:hypothetical protein
MPINPDTLKDRQSLHESIERSWKDWSCFRKKRKEYIEQMAGDEYNSAYPHVIVPKQYEQATTLVNKFAAKNPQVTVQTQFQLRRPFARNGELALNKRLKQIAYEDTLRKTVLDAVFMMGIQQVHNGDPYPLDFGDGYMIDPGLPTACHVPFEDFFMDTTGSCPGECQFVGKFHRIEREDLKRDPNIDAASKKAIEGQWANQNTRDNETLAKADSQGDGATADRLSQYVDLITVYLVRERRVVTLAKGYPQLPPLRNVKWRGGPHGPFRYLRFMLVPGQLMPMSPAMVIAVLDKIVNESAIKGWDQADRQKTVYAYKRSGSGDAESHRKSVDGDYIGMVDEKNVAVISNGGPDQSVQAFAQQMAMELNKAAGNLDAMAGLAPAADTLGQEQLLYGKASEREANLMQTVHTFMAEVMGDLFRLMFADEFYETQNFYEQGPISMEYAWRGGEREGTVDQYSIDVRPYSTVFVTPSQELQATTQFFLNTIIPLVQVPGANVQAILERGASVFNAPYMRDWLQTADPSPEDPNQFPEQMFNGNKPNGHYTRKGQASAGSIENQQRQVQQTMIRASSQQGSMPGVRSA